ncbi:uncharacterized protein VTP21DRAFT_9124 [Calcarisporiella thermophila]|uniref:uncharacterized protein n=1 Tax=Calcarisporiella thermophila TaxID=911321 RepID=UPI0037425882
MPQRTKKPMGAASQGQAPLKVSTLLSALQHSTPESMLEQLGFPRGSSRVHNREDLSRLLYSALICAKLLGSRVPHNQALRAADAFIHHDWQKVAEQGQPEGQSEGEKKAGGENGQEGQEVDDPETRKRKRQNEDLLLTPEILERTTVEQRTAFLRDNGFARYDESAARFLGQQVETILGENREKEQGDLKGDFLAWVLRGLDAGADREQVVKHLRARVASLKGMTEHAADVWLCMAQVYLSEPLLNKSGLKHKLDIFPYMDERARKTFTSMFANAQESEDASEQQTQAEGAEGKNEGVKGDEERRLLHYVTQHIAPRENEKQELGEERKRWEFVRVVDALLLCETEKKRAEVMAHARGEKVGDMPKESQPLGMEPEAKKAKAGKESTEAVRTEAQAVEE